MKSLAILLIVSQLLTLAAPKEVAGIYLFSVDFSNTFNKGVAVTDTGYKSFDDSKTSRDIIDKMGFGWNLGNTLDAYGTDQNQGLSSETYWGNPAVTEALIQYLYKSGFKAIRIPVSWHNHLIDTSYTIDPNWTRRVKTVVDWAIKYGLYVILNVHHDTADYSGITYGKGYYVSTRDRKISENFIYNVWSQIALAFNNGYDEHLIFEALNEPRPVGTTYEWWYSKGNDICEEASSALNEYLRVALKAIRESGGNNEKRFVMVPGLAASPTSTLDSDFIFPGDRKYNPKNEKIMLSVHAYQPYDFAMNADWSIKYFTDSFKNELYSLFKRLHDTYVTQGHHVVIGEMGAVDKGNEAERIKWGQYFISTARQFQLSSVLWDNHNFDNSNSPNEVFGYLQRNSLSWKSSNLINSWVQASSTPLSASSSSTSSYTSSSSSSGGEVTVVSSPVTFQNWNTKVTLSKESFSGFSSDCKISFTTTDPSYSPEYRAMVVNLGDWSSTLTLNANQVTGAYGSDGGITIYQGTNNVVFSLSAENLALAKQKGLILDGHGFTITKLTISGKGGSSSSSSGSSGASNSNLLDAKVNYDDANVKAGVYFAPELFESMTSSNKLVLETDNLFISVSNRYLILYKGSSWTKIQLNSGDAGTYVNNDYTLVVNPGSQSIKVNFGSYVNDLKKEGLTIRGYGFSLKGVYIQ